MTQKLVESWPPTRSASTRKSKGSVEGALGSKGSFGGVWFPSGSLRRKDKSKYVSIVVSVGGCGRGR